MQQLKVRDLTQSIPSFVEEWLKKFETTEVNHYDQETLRWVFFNRPTGSRTTGIYAGPCYNGAQHLDESYTDCIVEVDLTYERVAKLTTKEANRIHPYVDDCIVNMMLPEVSPLRDYPEKAGLVPIDYNGRHYIWVPNLKKQRNPVVMNFLFHLRMFREHPCRMYEMLRSDGVDFQTAYFLNAVGELSEDAVHPYWSFRHHGSPINENHFWKWRKRDFNTQEIKDAGPCHRGFDIHVNELVWGGSPRSDGAEIRAALGFPGRPGRYGCMTFDTLPLKNGDVAPLVDAYNKMEIPK